MSINKVILVGNLGSDPELRYRANELAVCSFSIATDYIKRNGEWGRGEREGSALAQYLLLWADC